MENCHACSNSLVKFEIYDYEECEFWMGCKNCKAISLYFDKNDQCVDYYFYKYKNFHEILGYEIENCSITKCYYHQPSFKEISIPIFLKLDASIIYNSLDIIVSKLQIYYKF